MELNARLSVSKFIKGGGCVEVRNASLWNIKMFGLLFLNAVISSYCIIRLRVPIASHGVNFDINMLGLMLLSARVSTRVSARVSRIAQGVLLLFVFKCPKLVHEAFLFHKFKIRLRTGGKVLFQE